MAFLEDMFKGKVGTGLAIGLGTFILGPVVIPLVGGIVKPLAKAGIKGGILLFEAGRRGISGAEKFVSGIVEEARREIEKGEREEKVPVHEKGGPHEIS